MPRKKTYHYIIYAFILAAIGLLAYNQVSSLFNRTTIEDINTFEAIDNPERNTPEHLIPEQLLTEQDSEIISTLVNDLWHQNKKASYRELPARLDFPAQAVYISARSEGRRLGEIWETRGTTLEALASAIKNVQKELSPEQISAADALEINFCYDFEEFFLDQSESRFSLFSNIHRGVKGFEIGHANQPPGRYAPTYIVASNRSNERLVELYREKHEISEEDFTQNARVFAFQAEQVLVSLGDNPRAVLMERGNTFVDPEAISRDSVYEMAGLAGGWLYNNVHQDGRMTYKYWPSSASESTANNMIRQWMATTALIRYGKAKDNPGIISLAEKNIDYNIRNFYHEQDGYGLIDCRDQVKLGALALAGLAILEHPERQKWAEQEKALQKTIDSLWNEDGSLTSFYIPEGDMRFQNFYPGEALLYWAFLYQDEPDPALLERFMKSFEYYRKWHLDPENRNPAFIPWHTQAYYIIWQETGYEPLKDFIFEMNDWLLPVQQWSDDLLYRDTLGRFYDPNRPFGPPHSSSTGVYLEGLIDAFNLARETGDTERMNNYRRAINRGLRSAMQLQFVDEVDMFYISPPMYSYVKGGIRTTAYNNEIRCDNVQHNLMAVLKILDSFEDEDFYHH